MYLIMLCPWQSLDISQHGIVMTINTDIGISKYIGEGGGEIYFRMLFTRNVILCLRYRYDIGRIQASGRYLCNLL